MKPNPTADHGAGPEMVLSTAVGGAIGLPQCRFVKLADGIGGASTKRGASHGKTVGVPIGAEQPVPDRQVAEVEDMDIDLVMNRMQFGSLDDIFQPSRRLVIRVIEELSRRGEHRGEGKKVLRHREFVVCNRPAVRQDGHAEP
jgi:hypothetical protein